MTRALLLAANKKKLIFESDLCVRIAQATNRSESPDEKNKRSSLFLLDGFVQQFIRMLYMHSIKMPPYSVCSLAVSLHVSLFHTHSLTPTPTSRVIFCSTGCAANTIVHYHCDESHRKAYRMCELIFATVWFFLIQPIGTMLSVSATILPMYLEWGRAARESREQCIYTKFQATYIRFSNRRVRVETMSARLCLFTHMIVVVFCCCWFRWTSMCWSMQARTSAYSNKLIHTFLLF